MCACMYIFNGANKIQICIIGLNTARGAAGLPFGPPNYHIRGRRSRDIRAAFLVIPRNVVAYENSMMVLQRSD